MRERKFAKRAFGGGCFWAPAWGEVRDINHTSQLPISALSVVPSQQFSLFARGVCGWRWGAGAGSSDWEWEPAGKQAPIGSGLDWTGRVCGDHSERGFLKALRVGMRL